MKKTILLALLVSPALAFSQVGINTSNPEATFDIRGKNHLGEVTAKDGILIPRVTGLSVNGTVNGQLVYLTANAGTFIKGFYYWNGSVWTGFAGDTSPDAWIDNSGNVVLASGSVGINTVIPNVNAALDIASTSKGLLVPRLDLVKTDNPAPLSGHVAGMVVYNTTTANDVLPGLYINDGTKWMSSSTASKVPDAGASTLPGISGNFISKGIDISSTTPTDSRLCLGDVCIRYNGSDARSNLEIGHINSAIFYAAYSNWGTTTSSGTEKQSDTRAQPGTGNNNDPLQINWAPIYNYGGVENTEGATTQVTVVNKGTNKVTSYTVSSQVIMTSDSGLTPNKLFIRFYQN